MARFFIKTDGASRGNPGPSGYGCVIENEDGLVLAKISGYIGEATNNVAEYLAAKHGIEGLSVLLNEEAGSPPELTEGRWIGLNSLQDDVTLFSDSELLVKQMTGEYAVKNEDLKKLHSQLNRICEDNFQSVKFMHIRRGLNSLADSLANDGIDDYLRLGRDQNVLTTTEE
jgi:ribonuclease HI